MLLISNKGNTNGSIPHLENTIEHVDNALSLGYNVKIDIWYHNKKLFLGQDGPKNEITWPWLIKNADYFWLNCMNVNTFSFLVENGKSLNFFYNTEDDVTITSKGIPWSSGKTPIKGTMTCDESNISGSLGLCSDRVQNWQKQIAICFYGESGLPSKKTIKNHKTNLIDVLESMGYYLEYYGSKMLNTNENDHKYNKIYNFKGLRSHVLNKETQDELTEKHIESIYEMIGPHPYETAFFIEWNQVINMEEILDHINNIE